MCVFLEPAFQGTQAQGHGGNLSSGASIKLKCQDSQIVDN